MRKVFMTGRQRRKLQTIITKTHALAKNCGDMLIRTRLMEIHAALTKMHEEGQRQKRQDVAGPVF